MRKITFVIFLWITCSTGFAQSDVIINTVTLAIAEGRYNDAERYTDSLLRIDSNSIDALMMKGNVLLNYAVVQTPALNNISAEDESIYSQDLVALKNPTVLIPRGQALKIVPLWQRCIAIDPGRLDIREGLCTLYGMADMRKELLDYLPVIAHAGRMKGDGFAYALMQYAQLLSDRGDNEGSYEAYKKIAALYPDMTSTWCQLATAYRDHGDLANAKLYADKAFAASKPDMAACGDALDIYAVLGEPARVLAVLKGASNDPAFPVYPFYDAIYKYAHYDTTWRKRMEVYTGQFAIAPDSDIVYAAASYMLSPAFHDSYEDFVKLLSFANSDFYTSLIIEKARHEYKDSIQPYIAEAKLMVDGHNYRKANELYLAMANKKMSAEVRAEYLLEYGYSLYCARDYDKAMQHFTKITNPAFATISGYFLGACYLKTGNKAKAQSYFQKIMDNKDMSKYAYLSKLQSDKIGKK